MSPYFPPDRPDLNDMTQFQNQQAQDFQMQQMQQQIDQQRFENQQLRSRQIPTRIYIGRNPLMVKMANEHPFGYLLFQIVRFLLMILLIYVLLYVFLPPGFLERTGWGGIFAPLEQTFLASFKSGLYQGLQNLQTPVAYSI